MASSSFVLLLSVVFACCTFSVVYGYGALPIGTARYTIPSSNVVYISPSGSDSNAGTLAAPYKTLLHAISANSAGVTIVARAGTYHEGSASGQYIGKAITVMNYPGEAVWFDGAVVLPSSGWVQQGATWVYSGWTVTFPVLDYSSGYNFVQTGSMAGHVDMVFYDGVQLTQVLSLPTAGQFAVNYTAQSITIGNNPVGHVVKATEYQRLLIIGGGPVNFYGVGFRGYAQDSLETENAPLYYGAATNYGAVIENVIFTDNALNGLSTIQPGMTIRKVSFLNNGFVGMGADHAHHLTVDNCLFQDNNYPGGWNNAPSDGAIKVCSSSYVTISNNYFVGNQVANGIWFDIGCTDGNIVNNTIDGTGGSVYCIEVEISTRVIVAGNTVSNCHYGITAYSSSYVQIYNNEISNTVAWAIGVWQDNRDGTNNYNNPSLYGYYITNSVINNNILNSATGYFQFYALDQVHMRTANGMITSLNGNYFGPTTGGTTAIGWCAADDKTMTLYKTPAALDAGAGVSYVNYQGYTTIDNNNAIALPSDVAAALNVATGLKHIGPLSSGGSASPTTAPTTTPTVGPTKVATAAPTKAPSVAPTKAGATAAATKVPTKVATAAPTKAPTTAPTKVPTTAPTTSVVIYADAFSATWHDYSWGSYNVAETTVVHTGTTGISINMATTTAIVPYAHTLQQKSAYSALVFWVNGGSISKPDLCVDVVDTGSVTKATLLVNSYVAGGYIPTNGWAKVVIPTSVWGSSSTFLYFNIKPHTYAAGTLYIDDISLSTPVVGAAAPSGDMTIYSDGFENSWSDFCAGAYNMNSAMMGLANSGSSSISLDLSQGGSIGAYSQNPISLSMYSALVFYIRTNSSEYLYMTIEIAASSMTNVFTNLNLTDYLPGGVIAMDTWSMVTIPSYAFNSAGTIQSFTLSYDPSTVANGFVFVDDITLESMIFASDSTVDSSQASSTTGDSSETASTTDNSSSEVVSPTTGVATTGSNSDNAATSGDSNSDSATTTGNNTPSTGGSEGSTTTTTASSTTSSTTTGINNIGDNVVALATTTVPTMMIVVVLVITVVAISL